FVEIRAKDQLDVRANTMYLSTTPNNFVEITTKDSYHHGVIRSGNVALKMTNSSVNQLQVRNFNDTSYADFTARNIDTTGDVRIRGDLRVDGSTSGVSSLSSDEDTINVFDEIISLRKRIKELEGEA